METGTCRPESIRKTRWGIIKGVLEGIMSIIYNDNVGRKSFPCLRITKMGPIRVIHPKEDIDDLVRF